MRAGSISLRGAVELEGQTTPRAAIWPPSCPHRSLLSQQVGKELLRKSKSWHPENSRREQQLLLLPSGRERSLTSQREPQMAAPRRWPRLCPFASMLPKALVPRHCGWTRGVSLYWPWSGHPPNLVVDVTGWGNSQNCLFSHTWGGDPRMSPLVLSV